MCNLSLRVGGVIVLEILGLGSRRLWWLRVRMEGSGEVVNCLENGSSSEGRPPNPLAAAYRQCFSGPRVAAVAPCKKKSLVRHASLVSSLHYLFGWKICCCNAYNNFILFEFFFKKVLFSRLLRLIRLIARKNKIFIDENLIKGSPKEIWFCLFVLCSALFLVFGKVLKWKREDWYNRVPLECLTEVNKRENKLQKERYKIIRHLGLLYCPLL